ncbi:hypothetical protein [Staphylospora marina]|uniref:hypothetical protein n=1 Tax=Staphylospora marina TaxID=2490858 RepID=UPI000F5BE3E3|nr:hypothetical protein [Staphylospora marina]
MEIKDITNNLDLIRKSRDLWNEFAYLKDSDSKQDLNVKKRYALAIELHYHWKPDDDYELVKFLMKNEVVSRRNDPYSGSADSLILISYLLARYRKPENVWLFEEAKFADFDTYCGYDVQFLFSAGVEATCRYLERHGITEDRPYLFENRDHLRSICTEEDIEKFFYELSLRFPTRIEDERVETLFDRAIIFGDDQEAERLFRLMEEAGEISDASLYYYAKKIKNYDKAIHYRRKSLKTSTKEWDQASLLQDIAELYCLKGEYANAFNTALTWEPLLKHLNWKETGLGRSLIETLLDISLGLHEEDDRKLSVTAFEKADSMLKKSKNITILLLEKAVLCSEKLGFSDLQRYYRRLLNAERKRIE